MNCRKEFKLDSIEHFQKMVNQQEKSNEELSNQVIQRVLNETKKNISNQLKEDLHKYVNYDESQQKEWMQLIHAQKNNEINFSF